MGNLLRNRSAAEQVSEMAEGVSFLPLEPGLPPPSHSVLGIWVLLYLLWWVSTTPDVTGFLSRSTSSATNVSREPRSWAERWTRSHSSSGVSITISIHSLVRWRLGVGVGGLEISPNTNKAGQLTGTQILMVRPKVTSCFMLHRREIIDQGNIKDDTWFFTQVWVSKLQCRLWKEDKMH